jgi:hypothetical protein
MSCNFKFLGFIAIASILIVSCNKDNQDTTPH